MAARPLDGCGVTSTLRSIFPLPVKPIMIRVLQADLNNPDHQAAILAMTRMYACDEMGNGDPLPEVVMDRLISEFQQLPTTLIFLALNDDQPVGIATCFRGLSTFAARPLINIHDFAVHPEYRGQGVGKALMMAVEEKARELNCVKLTLEVQAYNQRAQQAYSAFGFKHGAYGQFSGPLFLSKVLGDAPNGTD